MLSMKQNYFEHYMLILIHTKIFFKAYKGKSTQEGKLIEASPGKEKKPLSTFFSRS